MSFNSKRLGEIFTQRDSEALTELFSRGGLSKNIRLLCSMAYLQAEGDGENLRKILDLYIENEADFKKAYEVLLQGYLFCGYPRAIESFFCMNEVIRNKENIKSSMIRHRTLSDSDTLIKRGESLARIVHKDKSKKIRERINDICPDLAYLMIAEGYGHILYRDGLDSRVRELAIVATLTALDSERQLNSHIRGARNVGCEDLEIYEAIITGILWIDPEKIRKSERLWTVITGSDSPNSIDNIISRRV